MEIAHHIDRCIVRWGGQPQDYEPIQTFLDSSKIYLSDWRHRVLLHSTIGVFFVEELFPKVFTNSSNKLITARTIAEQHILEDLGLVPTAKWVLRELPSNYIKIDYEQLTKYLSFAEIRLIQKIELLAKDKAYIYYSDLGLEIMTRKFGVERFNSINTGLEFINHGKLTSVEKVLSKLPINRWLGGLKAKQIKAIQKLNKE